MADMTGGTPRQRAHAQTVNDIKRMAREQLGTEGSSGLSLRAIARQLGIVSSAVYRYVPSRDELLTMLIEDAYNSLGDAAEAADRRHRRSDLTKRWMAIGRAVRNWALEHPAEYGLLYGSPVPGYHAPPERTVAAGTRVMRLLGTLLPEAGSTVDGPPLPASTARDLRRVVAELDVGAVDEQVLVRGLLAWTAMYGLVSFELFGQYGETFGHPSTYFDYQLARLAELIGFTPSDQDV
jgi:AcrR family transcriptional regulator